MIIRVGKMSNSKISLKIVLKAASGWLKFVLILCHLKPKVRLNAPENVKWCNHKRMINIKNVVFLLVLYNLK